MTTKDYTANVISATKVVPDGNFKNSKASGVWDINEALDLIKGGNWPNAANINPAAFVDGLFSSDVWDGSGSARSITNDIDLSTKEGLVWIKKRSGSANHTLQDTVRGATKHIRSSGDSSESTEAQTITAFNSNGFSLGTDDIVNASGSDYVGWTFRSQPKFFDVVTYTGDGNYNDGNLYSKAIPHNLGVAPHVIIIKRLDSSSDWWIKHKDRTNYLTKLNTTDQEYQDSSPSGSRYLPIFRNGSGVSDATHFYLNAGDHTNGLNNPAAVLSNINNATYVAYLFAHNNDDGGFGEPGNQDIIKCGSYNGDGTTDGSNEITLGFEPQWIFLKRSDGGGYYSQIIDDMRGMVSGGNDQLLWPNVAAAENGTLNSVDATATGFSVNDSNNSNLNNSTWIYIAIRRGGMQTPTAASSVFGLQDYTSGGDGPVTGIVTDFSIIRDRDADAANYAATRLLGNSYLTPMLNSAEVSSAGAIHDRMDGAWNTSFAGYMIWGWQRARGYFDVVAYSGTGSNRTISHNLGVTPEMMWVKRRNTTNNWKTFHSNLGGTKSMELNTTVAAETNGSALWNSTAPTASVYSLGTASDVNGSGSTYVAYLFATVANVSKVGSFTQSGATNVACGFTGDTPALIILKRTDDTGNWYILDSVRGIVAGNDPHTYINESNPEISNVDLVDPYSGGFATTSSLTDGDYIFYSIAAVS